MHSLSQHLTALHSPPCNHPLKGRQGQMAETMQQDFCACEEKTMFLGLRARTMQRTQPLAEFEKRKARHLLSEACLSSQEKNFEPPGHSLEGLEMIHSMGVSQN